MLFPRLAFLLAVYSVAPTALARPQDLAKRSCTSAQRIAGAEYITTSFNNMQIGGSAAAFSQFPVEQNIHAYINPNGAGEVPVAIDKTTFIDFATAARQIFYQVVSEYTDYPNGTTIMNANVTLGAAHAVALPVTFNAYVFLNYNLDDCLIGNIDVVATIPTVVAGIPIEPPILPQILAIAQLTDPLR